jgi:hypothetical protein
MDNSNPRHATKSLALRAFLAVTTIAFLCLVAPASASAGACATNLVVVPIAMDRQVDYEEFLDVDVLSSSSAWAVGQTNITGPAYDSALAMHWDGASWARVAVPPYGEDGAKLHGVAVVSDSDVWATGWTESLPGPVQDHPLAIHWNGSRWRRFAVPLPAEGGGGAELRRVFALSSDDVWAVGWYHRNDPRGRLKTLIVHWDGTAWSQVPSANVHGRSNQLFGVTATAPDAAWAVGRAGGQMLLERWNGSQWTMETIEGRTRGWLNDIDASPSGKVLAVGMVRRSSPLYHGVVLSRSTSGWKHMDIPHARGSILSGVSWATTRAYAVGNGADGPVALKWIGASWVNRTVGDTANGYPDLNAVGAATDGTVWTVGLRITKGGDVRTVAETICR